MGGVGFASASSRALALRSPERSEAQSPHKNFANIESKTKRAQRICQLLRIVRLSQVKQPNPRRTNKTLL